MIEKIISMIKNGEIPLNYRDPQELIWGEERTPESDVYSYGMMIFEMICGKSYFEHACIPEDECFMMADTDSEASVLEERYMPEEVMYIYPLLKSMTVYRKNARAEIEEVIAVLERYLSSEEVSDENADSTSEEKSSCPESPYRILPEYDYGVILNNKKSGRIEFKVLLDHEGNTINCDIPVYESGIFRIAVSRRHSSSSHISNPSSVYGDCIIPVGIAQLPDIKEGKIRITAGSVCGELALMISGIDMQGNETGAKIKAGWGNSVC